MKRILVFALLFSAATALLVDPSRAQSSPPPATKTAIFAGGCFWCIQPAFDKAKGVIKTVVGYSGGTEPNPTYELVSSEKTGYRESIEITYDPTKISFDQLLDIYWRQIDPTQADGQFTDIGPSYRAAIFYSDNDEKKIADASKEKLSRSGKFDKPIVTEILPAMKFYPAEANHQTRSTSRHSRKDRAAFPSKRKPGATADSVERTSMRFVGMFSVSLTYINQRPARLQWRCVGHKVRSNVLSSGRLFHRR